MQNSELKVKILSKEDFGKFDKFVQNHENGYFMQSSAWAKVKCEWAHEVIAIVNSDDEICGGMSVLIRKMGISSLMYAPRGPVCDYKDSDILALILEGAKILAKKHNAHVLKVDPYIMEDDSETISLWKKSGFSIKENAPFKDTVQPRYNYMLNYIKDLSEDELMAKFVRDTRYYIRYPQKKGVVCKHGTELMDDFYKIYSETGDRQGFMVRPRAYLERFINSFDEDTVRLYMCYYDGKPLCGGIAVNYAGKTAHVYGCSTDEMRNVRPTYLLQWELMKWALSTNCSVYDMQGVAIKKEDSEALFGVLGFKQNFTGDIITTAGEFEVVYNPVMNKAIDVALAVRRKMYHH